MTTADTKTGAGIYVIRAGLMLVILIPLWTLFVMTVIEPASLIMEEQTMGNRFLWWILGPIVLVATVFGTHWVKAARSDKDAPQHDTPQAQKPSLSEQQRREYVLEVIGLGVTLDKYRQAKLWEALQAGNPHATIREQDPNKYPWSELDKGGMSGERGGDALENGASFTPMYFAVPVFNAEPEAHNAGRADTPESPTPGLAGGAIGAGMAWHLFVVGPRRFGEYPDRILEDVFAFFDAHPDVPYIVLNSEDSLGTRESNSPDGAPPLLRDGHYVTEKPDASALFVLARRERVDPVRPFVWDDPDNEFVQNEFRWMYGNMRIAVPNSQRKHALQTPAQVGADMTRQELRIQGERQPLVSEWLEAAAAFSQRPDLRGTGVSGMLGTINPFKHYPPREWKPTPWFPIPWNREQLETFDRLPTLGYLHRPTFVRLTDEQGRPVTRRADREKLLLAGWQAALQTLPEARRASAPARVIAATGGNTERLVALHGVLGAQAAAGGPELDSSKPGQFIDTDKRLGDTGAATLFVQMAIGVMGSYRDGGISAAVNLRSPNEASIILITPPTDEQRRNQKHPRGGDVFAHRGTPVIDPGNYQ
ncbi:DUF2875 family protein [Massilia oculi]|uniref:DUF2875 family protein n=1 Tax=Massilia hydrophila TaxID=3044279 RepID=A0ABS7YDP2_9BURK|nr:DUF2875 family protein [Massilia oculi]MCA1857836.1 DUF2875 family protein [Massilia oculi]